MNDEQMIRTLLLDKAGLRRLMPWFPFCAGSCLAHEESGTD